MAGLVLVPAVLFIAAGCGMTGGASEDDAAADAASVPDRNEAGIETVDAGPAAPADDLDTTAQSTATIPLASAEPAASPLADLFGIPVVEDDTLEDRIIDVQRDAERRIATCMRAQGFEYAPVDYGPLLAIGAALGDDSREFAETYGFGIANVVDDWVEGVGAFGDPNVDIVESLSDGERVAYYEALVGRPEPFTIDDLDDPEGCTGDAYRLAYGQFSLVGQFGSELDQLRSAIDADPRIVALNETWSSCMSERGFAFAEIDEPRADIQRRFRAITNEGPVVPEGDEVVTVVIGQRDYSPEIQVQVDELAREEIAVAIAAWDCDQPARATYDEVRLEYERNWVDQYGDAVRAASPGG